MNIKTFFGVIALYIFLNNPIFNVLGFGLIKLLILLSLIYFISFKGSNFSTFKNIFSHEVTIFSVLIFIILARTILGGDPAYLRTAIVAVFEVFFIPWFLIQSLQNDSSNSNNDNIIRLLIITGFIGAVISATCIAVPQINAFIKFNLIRSDDNEFLYRGFGAAEDLNGTYGIVQIILLIVFLYSPTKKNIIDWCFIPLLFISAFFNARTSLIILVIGILSYTIFSFKTKNIVLLFIAVFVVPILIDPLLELLNVSQETVDWINLFFENINDYNETRDANSSSMAGALFEEMIVWPNSLTHWICGTGIDIFRFGNRNSDIGFIRQLNYGGIIYLLGVVYFIYKCTKRLWLSNNKSFALFFLFAFIVCNYKGQFVLNTGGFRLMMLLYFYYIITYKKIC